MKARSLAVALCAGTVALLAGCAHQVAGTATPGEPLVTSTAADPNSPEARWMNRFCGIGKLLITAGDTNPTPESSSDPAVLRQQFLDATGRLVGVLDAVLSDLRGLRPAPAPELDPVIGSLVDDITESRAAIAEARADVEAAQPLTVEVYRRAVDRFGTGLNGFEKAVSSLDALKLPDQLADAAGAAKNCAESGPPTTTTG